MPRGRKRRAPFVPPRWIPNSSSEDDNPPQVPLQFPQFHGPINGNKTKVFEILFFISFIDIAWSN